MKIVIASDSFKGSLTSNEVAAAATRGIKAVYPDCHVVAVNVADGGEGTVEAVVEALHGQIISVPVSDPLGRPIQARYGIAGQTAIMEMAAASGLPLLSPHERNPWLRRDDHGCHPKGMSQLPHRHRWQCHQRCRYRHATSHGLPLLRCPRTRDTTLYRRHDAPDCSYR